MSRRLIASMVGYVSHLPGHRIRRAGYLFLGQNLGGIDQIGRKTVVLAEEIECGEGVSIGSNCAVTCRRFVSGANTRILSGNVFQGAGEIVLGKNVKIINDHYFDLWHNIYIGDDTWIAGRDSQFWTHGTTKACKDPDIRIGSGCYIGSRVLFAPGAGVGDGCLVALGSVVARRFEEPNCLIAGVPARIVRRDFFWKEEWA